MNRLHLILTAALCATPLSVALPSSAAAQQAESVQITVRVIVASASGAPDAALQSVAARLQAQFPEFSGFAQHSTTTVTLGAGEEQRISVPGGGNATIRHLGVESGQHRFDVAFPGGSTQVRMPASSVFFVGGAAVPAGKLILMLDT